MEEDRALAPVSASKHGQ